MKNATSDSAKWKTRTKQLPTLYQKKLPQVERIKEAQNIGARSQLVLPSPQVGERELEEIVKIGQAGESARTLVDEGANESSKGLLGDYSALAHAKNARTPRTAPQGDSFTVHVK